MIRPVDMQLTLPKTIDYARQTTVEASRQVADQQMAAQISQKTQEQKQTMVIETREKGASVNKDGHNKQEYEQSKKGREEKEKERDEQKNKGTALFDIRI